MTMFYVLAALLTLAVVGALARPLLRASRAPEVSQQKLNASVYREQLAALDRELAGGTLTQAEFDTARDEIHLRLLEDEKVAAQAQAWRTPKFWTTGRTAWTLALLIPLASAGTYAWLGAPAAINAEETAKARQAEVIAMVEGLAARLKASPDANPTGWAMLARSYKVLGRLQEAEEAFAKVGPALEQDPDLLASYADLIAARTDTFGGKASDLIQKALALNPRHPMALMLAGTAAYRAGDFTSAAAHWEKLLPVLDPNSPDYEQLQADIAEARAKGRNQPAMASSPQTGSQVAKAAPAASAPQAMPQPPGTPEQMVERLAARLKANPDDPQGWARLARAYKVLGRLPDAEQAYAKAGKLVDSDPDMLADLADLVALRQGTLEGRPLELAHKALALNPKQPVALMLVGTASFRKGDYKGAIAQWEKLKPVFPPGSPEAEWLNASLAEARSKAAGSPPVGK